MRGLGDQIYGDQIYVASFDQPYRLRLLASASHPK